ncbi:MAG: hypothetical protein JRJ15_07715 [Deltaproteobacteria bacterium]|nr:hypothetical protein [Deltaproteobacteria bacterium]
MKINFKILFFLLFVIFLISGAAIAMPLPQTEGKLPDCAKDQTPLFGSQDDAARASNCFQDATADFDLIAVRGAPAKDEPLGWLPSKVKGLGVGLLLIHKVTNLLKEQAVQTKPNDSSDQSFSLSHASNSLSLSPPISNSLESFPLSSRNKTPSHFDFRTLSEGSAWADAKARLHYPSDLLVGHAPRHLLSCLLNGVFFGLDQFDNFRLSIEPSKNGVMVGLRWAY